MRQSQKRNVLLVRVISFIIFVTLVNACGLLKPSTSSQSSSYKIIDDSLFIGSNKGTIRITALTNRALEVVYLKNGPVHNFNKLLDHKPAQFVSYFKQELFPSFAIKENVSKQSIDVQENRSEIILIKGKLKAVINKLDLGIQFFMADKLLSYQKPRLEVIDDNSNKSIGFDFALTNDEKVLGGGERVLGMDRRGHRMPLYNRAHYGYQTHSNQMNFSLPIVMSSKKYAILFDNSASGFLDIGKTKLDTLSFEAVGGRSAYVFFAGKSYPELINNYVEVTGKQPLPPRWLFGNFSSRFGYKSQQEVLDTVERFKQEDFPLDAIIIDLYWFGADIKGFMGSLEWDKNTFPKPLEMLNQLNENNIKSVLVTEPFVLSGSSKWQEAVNEKILVKEANGTAKRFDFYFGNTGLIDIFDERAKNWFSQIYTDLTKQGVSGVWGDLGEPEVHPDDSLHYLSNWDLMARGDEVHNAYGHEWANLVYQNQRKIKPFDRPFIMMRSGFAGSQRYGMIPWTGDVDRSWLGLKPQVELSLQMGLFGLAYTHSDLGGFAGGKEFDKEMYIRWLQYGVFQPVYRPHAQDHIAPEPVFHDKETKDILRDYVKLRYQLLPYNYNLAYQNSLSGLPLMRPVFFEDENNTDLIDIKDTFLWGDAFLVSPITSPNEKSHGVNLPDGFWFNFWNDSIFEGGKEIEFPVTLKTLPVLVRAGSFIPMINSISNTTEYSSRDLTVHYYAHDMVKTSQYELYEDDGINPNSITSEAFEILKFTAKHENKNIIFNFTKDGNGYEGMPNERTLNMVVHNWTVEPNNVLINNDKTRFDFNERLKTLTIKFKWKQKNNRLIVN